MLRVRKKFSVAFIICILFLIPLYGISYSIKSDSMIIYATKGENRTKFFNNIRFEMDSIYFTSKFAEMLGDTLFVLSNSVIGKSKGNVYETDTMYFNQKTSFARFISGNRFVINGNTLEGDSFILNIIDSTMEMNGNVKFLSSNDSIAINSDKGLIINREKLAIFYENPILKIKSDSNTIVVTSDTIIFENDSIARFVNNLHIKMKEGKVKGGNGLFFIHSQSGIIRGAPKFISKEMYIKGDTMSITSKGSNRNILFYNNSKLEYNNNDSMSIKADSIEVNIENDTVKTLKAFGDVNGSYRRNER